MMDISPTYAKQEVDVLKKILYQSGCSESLAEVKFKLSDFEGKHFNHLATEQILQRVMDIATKLKNMKLINGYAVEYRKDIAKETDISFDIGDKIPSLQEYKDKLEDEIARVEIKSKLKKSNYCWLDRDTKTFYFTLRNGSPKSVPLWTERAESTLLYLLFTVLYENWLEFGDQVITKVSIRDRLNKLGCDNVSDYKMRYYIKNIRSAKIKPAQLSPFITIPYVRKLKGYKFVVTYP